MNFKNRLKELREEKGLSQVELSKRLNISNVTLSQYENGVRKPDITTLNALADFFKVTVDYILGRSNKRDEDGYDEVKILARDAKELTDDQLDLIRSMIKQFKESNK